MARRCLPPEIGAPPSAAVLTGRQACANTRNLRYGEPPPPATRHWRRSLLLWRVLDSAGGHPEVDRAQYLRLGSEGASRECQHGNRRDRADNLEVCESDAWKSLRYNSALTDACKENSKQHVDMMTNLWKDKTSDEYKDPAIALRMKRAICPHQDIGACDLKVLPSDYEPLRPDECQVCRALVSDLFGIVRRSRDRPKSAKSDAYFRLISAMGSVCTELPMRHAMRSTSDREKVTELCEDIWDEHESSLSRIALRRSAEYAQALCSEELEVCDEPLSMAELFSHDPGASSADEAKDEL